MTYKKTRQRSAADPQRVTLKQIADEVGLPVMTISLALRNVPGRVSEATRARVQAVADRLGYRPNLMAQAMQTGRSHNIGVVVRPVSDFGGRLVDGIHDSLYGEGWLPILHYQRSGMGLNSTPEAELEIVHRLLDRRVDGLILFPADAKVSDDHFKEIWKRKVPMVTVDHLISDARADFVGTDDHTGGRLAAAHLLALGHQRIAQLAGRQRYTAYADRRQGFDDGLRGSKTKVKTIELVNEERESVISATNALLDAAHRPTAIFSANDHVAAVVHEVCLARGLRIPQDISLVGYADLEYIRYLSPPLTTIAQDPYVIGQQAATLILRRCRKDPTLEEQPQRLRITPSLVVRASSGPAPQT